MEPIAQQAMETIAELGRESKAERSCTTESHTHTHRDIFLGLNTHEKVKRWIIAKVTEAGVCHVVV